MKMSKKLTSILCAVALLVSALPAASAVSTEPLSEYAGQTIAVQAVDVSEAGTTSRIVEVSIPENATEAEANALAYSAAFSQGGISALSVNETLYPLSTENNLEITATPQRVGGGSMPSGVQLDSTLVRVDIGWIGSPDVRLLFQVRDLGGGVASTPWDELNMNNLPWQVYIRYSGFPVSNRGIAVYAKTSVDRHVFLNSCKVFGVVD